jgi:hypothetical protein
MNAAERFRAAVERRDVTSMIDAMALDVELHSPTVLGPVRGREMVRRVFLVLVDLFQDFEYTRVFDGRPAPGEPGSASSHALMFRCRIDEETIEGIDVLELDATDQIARFTVLIRPMSGLRTLAEAIPERLRAAR